MNIQQQFPAGTKILANGATLIVVGHYGGSVPVGQQGFTNKQAAVLAVREGGGCLEFWGREDIVPKSE